MTTTKKQLYIPVIEGTTRQKRNSIHVARLIHEVASSLPEVKSEMLDPADFTTPYDGNDPENKDPRYSKITKEADGFFMVVPEYNHSFPGTLKRFIDSELRNYTHKPVAFAGVSTGPWGGVRAIELLVPVVRTMGLVPTFTDVQFPKVEALFDENGQLQDDAYKKRIKRAYQELIWMAKTLRWGRQNLERKK